MLKPTHVTSGGGVLLASGGIYIAGGINWLAQACRDFKQATKRAHKFAFTITCLLDNIGHNSFYHFFFNWDK
ncbi:MAG: hypothetical protein AAF696_23180 [Bacteroidota bacterium]